MKIKKITAVYFSPTGGTARYARLLAGELGGEKAELNLTDFDTRSRECKFTKDELVILAAPVYAGRLPQIEGGIFGRLKGGGTPAVCIVGYGNRDYDDALLELKDISAEKGFVCMAAGAFVTPHSFSSKAGAGRPDKEDLTAIKELAAGVKKALEAGTPPKDLPVKGNSPYKEYKKVAFTIRTSGACNSCGLCAAKCPVKAIPADRPYYTDKAKCISCFCCIKICPQKARGINIFARLMLKIFEKKVLLKERKKAGLFLS